MANYSDEKNVQITLALLKAHGIRRIIANPGSSNFSFVGSIQSDPYFEVYSAVDERHAAYMACGIADETGEPVVLNCTGATSSREYMPGLTEAFYRKLPVLVITSSQVNSHLGQLWAQMTDRLHPPSDTVRLTVDCPVVRTRDDERICSRYVNEAILELSRYGGGPSHINLQICHCTTFNTTELPVVQKIERIMPCDDNWPALPDNAKIAIWVGSHRKWTKDEAMFLRNFVMKHNAVVLTDHTGGLSGGNVVKPAILCSQGIRNVPRYIKLVPDLIIHLGEISGDAPTNSYFTALAPVWRVNPDGEIRDRLNGLVNVFEMTEDVFFRHYETEGECLGSYANDWRESVNELRNKVTDLPFSNPWIAQQLHNRLPKDSVLHFSILNSLRSWNYFDVDSSIITKCNVGGFGIDGCTSSLIGASLTNPDKQYFLVSGDLAFFYDLNALGNRHIGKNIHILLVNNGAGGEFNMYNNATSQFGDKTNDYIAAGGHFGCQSKELVKHLASDLGFKYLSADTKESFDQQVDLFLQPSNESIVFECFTKLVDDSDALQILNTLDPSAVAKAKYTKYIPASVKSVFKKLI